MVPRLLTSVLFRPLRLLIVSLILVYTSTQIIMKLNDQNPNSHFFAPEEKTYAPIYSGPRKQVAREFIAEVESKMKRGELVHKKASTSNNVPDLAVVFVSVKRKREQYLDASLGSFMRELTPDQRNEMTIAVDIGDFNPSDHPFYQSAWLHGMVDQVGVRMAPKQQLTLDIPSASAQPLARTHVTPVPVVDVATNPLKTSAWHRKATLDYAFALTTCHEIGAPHCLVVEDDTLFAANWYKQVKVMLRKADRVSSPKKWGYIRMFYSEKYFGWENEEVPKLVSGCIAVTLLAAIFLFAFCKVPARQSREKDRERDYNQLGVRMKNEMARVRLPLGSILILVLVVLIHAILFILAGRNHVYKVPRGLSVMESRGCCTQAIIYPQSLVHSLSIHLLDHSGQRPYDIMINRWMEAHHRDKLAINPPVVQHIGEGSSREMAEDYWRRTPLWSFAFESMQPLDKA